MAFPIRRTVTKDPETGSKVKTLSYLGKNVKYVRETTKSKDGKDKTVKSALGVGKAGYGDFRAFKRKEKSSFEGKRISKAVQTTVRDKEGKVLGGKSVEKRGGVKTSLKDRVVTGNSTYKESYPNKDYNKKAVMKAAKEGAKEGAAMRNDGKKISRINNKIERLENRKQRIGSDEGMNKRQFERAGNIRKKQYELTKKLANKYPSYKSKP